MTSWQKRARLVIAVVGLGVIVAVLLTVRGRRPADEADPVVRVDPTAVAESAGGRTVLARGARMPGVVDFERMLSYADGTAKFLAPTYTTERDGREFVVRSREATVAADQSQVVMTGDVRMRSEDGWTAETQQATFNRGEDVIRAPGAFAFEKGTMRGSSVGMTYDQRRDVLWLLDRVTITVAPDASGGSSAEITAGSAGYARRDRYVRFERSVRLVRDGRVIEAEGGLAHLSADESRLERLELQGESRILTPDPAPGGLQEMCARDMNLVYAAEGETLERATLSDGACGQPVAVIQFAGTGDAAGRRLSGRHIDITFGPEGEVSALSARDQVELALPATGDSSGRVIRSAAMEGTGRPGQGLSAATFSGGVEFREAAAGNDAPRVARARTLTAAMDPASGGIEDARFAGGTRFEHGALRASAVDGRYQVTKGVLELSGSDGTTDPRVENERLTVDAKRIELTFEGPRLVATTEVRSVLRPAPKSERGGGSQGLAVPGMLEDNQPVYITGAALRYDGARSRAEYTGGSRLWQADTTIQGETIVLDESTGDLRASGGPEGGLVRSAFALEQQDETTGKPVKVPSLATARELHYEDAARRATYTTDAHVNGPPGDCHAAKIELYFAEAGGTLERAEAYERVRLTADARAATGDRMTYFASDERYLMTGTPVRITEECRETTGKTLTFWRSTDRILVDGNEEIRTLTKSGGACAQTRFE
jgi:LPS export ABC transporter protein LptC